MIGTKCIVDEKGVNQHDDQYNHGAYAVVIPLFSELLINEQGIPKRTNKYTETIAFVGFEPGDQEKRKYVERKKYFVRANQCVKKFASKLSPSSINFGTTLF